MKKTLTIEPPAEEATKLHMAIQQCLTEIEQLRKQMKSDQAEIDQSSERTRAMLERLAAG